MVVVMQRVKQEDLVGYLEQQGGFESLNLPAIAQKTLPYQTGPTTSHDYRRGEILHPEHESAEVLLGLKKAMGSMSFSAQYQQTPFPAGGTFIKRKWLKSYSRSELLTEPRDRTVISWDIALSETQAGDSSAGVILRCRGDTFYVLEVAKGQYPFKQLSENIRAMARRYPRASLLIEESPISLGLIQALRQENVSVVAIKPSKDKHSRVISQTDRFEPGSRFFSERGDWSGRTV